MQGVDITERPRIRLRRGKCGIVEAGMMAGKTARRVQLEQSLADDPTDTFLRYGLALQCLREGDVPEGRQRLQDLIADHPDQVAAYQQLGQSFLESSEQALAGPVLEAGIAQACLRGDAH